MKTINRLLLQLFGYKIDTVNIPPEAKKCVLLFAPHTSMTDFLIGRMSLSAMGVKTVFLIKKEAFWFPLGNILRALADFPSIENTCAIFTQYARISCSITRKLHFLLPPQGTRALNPNWKKGFYYIRTKSKCSYCLGILITIPNGEEWGLAFYSYR